MGWRQDIAQLGVREGLRLLRTSGSVEPHRDPGHEGTTRRMVGGREVERAPPQVGGRARVGRGTALRCGLQRGDGELVARLGAGGELTGDIDRQGSGREQHRGGLTVQPATPGDRDAVTHRVSREVVAELKVAIPLDEHAAVNQFVKRVEQRGGWLVEHGCDLVQRKAPPE